MSRWLRWLVTPLVLACGGTEKPACSAERLAEMEAAYIAAVLHECSDYKTPEECPAYPGLQQDAAARRREWVECR